MPRAGSSAGCEGPGHDDVALGISAEGKDMLAHLYETLLAVERDGFRVVLPDPEPDRIRTASFHLLDAGRYQRLRDAPAVPLTDDVDPLDLAGSHARDAMRCRIPAKLCIPDQVPLVFGEQGD